MRMCNCRSVSGGVSALVLSVLSVQAADRICSVYMESPSALQMQIQQASQVFEAPELGMYPMMMTMMVPGGSQVSMSEPVSLHVFDMGDGRTAGLVELTPATTAEMFLKSLTAASGVPLAPAVEGRYVFEGGVAQVRGARLLLARTADELDACTGGAVPALPPLPAIPGVIRIAMAPAAVVPMLDGMKAQCIGSMAAGGPDVAQAQEMMEMVFGLYTRALAQINAVNIGIAVQPEGLMIRAQMVPVSGSTIASTLATMQPVDPAYLSFVQKGELFAMASGSYTLPDQLKHQIVSLYIKMVKASPQAAGIDTEELSFAMRESVESLGAALAWSGGMTPDGSSIMMQGSMGIVPALSYLEKMVAMSSLPVMKAITAQSGVSMGEAVKRLYKDYPVYHWSFSLDEAALRKQMGAGAQEMDEQAFAAVRKMMRFFGSGYDYAATPRGVAFGLGSASMVEQASDRLMADAPDLSESARIRALLSPVSAPVALGRFGLLDAVRAGARMATEVAGVPPVEAIAGLPAGEGIIFADWITGIEVNSALLVPAADIKAISAMAKSMRGAAMAAAQAAEMEEDGAVVEEK